MTPILIQCCLNKFKFVLEFQFTSISSNGKLPTMPTLFFFSKNNQNSINGQSHHRDGGKYSLWHYAEEYVQQTMLLIIGNDREAIHYGNEMTTTVSILPLKHGASIA